MSWNRSFVHEKILFIAAAIGILFLVILYLYLYH